MVENFNIGVSPGGFEIGAMNIVTFHRYVMDMYTTDVESGKTTGNIRGSYSRSGHFRIDTVHTATEIIGS